MNEKTPKDRLLSALRKDRRYKFRELKAITSLSNERLARIISELRREGYKIVTNKIDKTFFLSKVPTPYSNYFDMSFLPCGKTDATSSAS